MTERVPYKLLVTMASLAFPDISIKLQLPSGTTYGFAHVEPSGDKPYILLLHGFPSSAYDWRHQIHFLARVGNFQGKSFSMQ